MSKDKMLVFGYARVSTDNQIENYSIDEQVARLEAYCAAKGWTLLHTYIDGGFSGGNTDRPALQEMLKAIKENQIDAVVVYKLDRLSRSQKDTLTLIEDELLKNGTDFVSINENFDTSTPFGRAMIGILSVFAQLEKDQITERFTMGRIGRSKAGYYHGGANAPTGYDYTDGVLLVNEYEAVQVRELFSLFLSGKSINWIAKHLKENYGTRWTPYKISYALKNSVYIGKVKFNGQEYDGIHQPIIDKKTFDMAGMLLISEERENNKTTSQKTPFRAGYLLSGLVFCEQCGARYSANHGYYKCYSRAKSSPKFIKDPSCKNENWKIEELDQLICEKVDELIANPEIMQSVMQECEKNERVKVNKDAIKKQIAEIEKQISKLIDLYQLGSIPIQTITQRVNDMSKEKEVLHNKLNESDSFSTKDLFYDAVEAYKDGFSHADTEKKRMLISSLIERIGIDEKTVKIYWRV